MRISVVVLAFAACSALADEHLDVVPYRPSVAEPATLPRPRTLELELGWERERQPDERRTTFPYLLKYAFDERWAMLVEGDAHARMRDADGVRSGFGDTALLVKRFIKGGGKVDFALQGGARLPTSATGVGNGKPEYPLMAIGSLDLGKVGIDLNYRPVVLREREPGTGRVEHGWAVEVDREIGNAWKLGAELSGTRRENATPSMQTLAYAQYAVSRRAVVDLGVARSVVHSPRETRLFAGLVISLARRP